MEDHEDQTHPLLTPRHHTPDPAVVFTAKSDDIAPIAGAGDFAREFFAESKKLWYLAGPAIFTSVCQYSLGAVTQVFSGHVSTLALAAISIENSVIAGFCLGITVRNLTGLYTYTHLVSSHVQFLSFNSTHTHFFNFYMYLCVHFFI